MERLRELRGPDTRERDLANILGFEHSRAVRWKEGQMYVDRAEYLVRLADALDVETMLLVAMASGTLTVEQAHRFHPERDSAYILSNVLLGPAHQTKDRMRFVGHPRRAMITKSDCGLANSPRIPRRIHLKFHRVCNHDALA